MSDKYGARSQTGDNSNVRIVLSRSRASLSCDFNRAISSFIGLGTALDAPHVDVIGNQILPDSYHRMDTLFCL